MARVWRPNVKALESVRRGKDECSEEPRLDEARKG